MVAFLVVVVLGQSSPMGVSVPGRLTVNEQPAPAPPSPSDDDWAGTKPLQSQVRAPESTQPEHWPDGATKRFVGALVGGAVGAALPLVTGGLATNGCPSMVVCPGWAFAGGLAAPVLAVVGSSIGYALMGGEPSVGVALAGMLGGLGAAAAVLFFDAFISGIPNSRPGWPSLFVASGLAVSFSVLAMVARSEAVERLPFIASPMRRVVLTALSLVGTLGLEALLIGLAATSGSSLLTAVLVLGALGASPLIPVAVHRALGGRGSFGAAYLGWAASLGVAGIGFLGILATGSSLFTLDPRFIGLSAISITGGVLAAALGVPLFLEWSHGNALIEESEKALAVKAQLSVAPVAGPTGLTGGALALSGTF